MSGHDVVNSGQSGDLLPNLTIARSGGKDQGIYESPSFINMERGKNKLSNLSSRHSLLSERSTVNRKLWFFNFYSLLHCGT